MPTARSWSETGAVQDVLTRYLASDHAPTLAYGASAAVYLPSRHHIQLPSREQFTSDAGFYGTAFHGATHSTGHRSIGGRDLSVRFCSGTYGREEPIAEIGSAMVLATIGIDGEFSNSVGYIDSWIRTIQGDVKLVVQAASAAQRAADRILGVAFGATERDWQ
jgi:antirestriction protein ArdC